MGKNVTISFSIDLEKQIDVLQEITKKVIRQLEVNNCDIVSWCIEREKQNY